MPPPLLRGFKLLRDISGPWIPPLGPEEDQATVGGSIVLHHLPLPPPEHEESSMLLGEAGGRHAIFRNPECRSKQLHWAQG